jgi:hypothetical protein
MLRALLTLILMTVPLLAANIRLYLTDGACHVVREYEVKPDRVRFYSVERSAWEEMPLELVDLERTENEIREREAARRKEMEWLEGEERAEREHAREVASVPMGTGVYLVESGRMRAIPQAELDVQTDKKRSILKAVTPIPIVAGKRIVLMKGEHSSTVVPTPNPEFYIRLYREERFGIIRLTPKKGVRLVEEWGIAPVTNQVFEIHTDVEAFRRQVGDNLYKIWPEEPLTPGEYAVVEFSAGEANIQAWDFGYWPEGAPAKK